MITNRLKIILLCGFIVGTLDILGAIVLYGIILEKTTATRILQTIASGVFGPAAYAGGLEMAAYGLVFHYCIATTFSAVYCYFFPFIPMFKNQKIISGIVFGAVVWLIMNLIVLPLSNVNQSPFTLQGVSIGITFIIVLIGLPLSLMTHQYYSSQKKK